MQTENPLVPFEVFVIMSSSVNNVSSTICSRDRSEARLYTVAVELIDMAMADQDEAQEKCQKGHTILYDGLWGIRYRSVFDSSRIPLRVRSIDWP